MIRLIYIFLLIPVAVAGMDQATMDALKVQHILKNIAARQSRPDQQKIRQAVITQSELNAYIVYRLNREKNPIIKSLEVVLLDNGRIRGKIRFDPDKMAFLKLLDSKLKFDFDGRLQTRDGAGKLELISLHLNGQSMPPRALDPVLAAVALYYGNEPGGIDDWYELPQGIRRIAVSRAKMVLYY